MEVCAELGYRPNYSARAMRTGNSNCLTFLLCREEHTSDFPRHLFYGINAEISNRNLLLNVAQVEKDKLTDSKFFPRFLNEWMSDGVLIGYTIKIKKLEDLLKRYRIPAVWINSKHKYSSVYPDDFSGAVSATEHLIELGHTRIAYVDLSNEIDSDISHFSSVDRRGGYLKTIQKAGLEPILWTKKLHYEDRGKYICDKYSSTPENKKPTAYLTYAGGAAACILYHISSRFNLNFPKDVSLLTFGAEREEIFAVPIDSMVYPSHEMGKYSVDMLIKKIKKPIQKIDSKKFEYSLMKAETCGPPPKK